MNITEVSLPFLACESSTMIECSGVDKDMAEGIAVALGYVVQEFIEDDLDFILDGEVIGIWRIGDLSLFIDEGSEAETKYKSLGGEEWIKKLLTGKSNSVQ